MLRLLAVALILASPAAARTLIAAHTLRAQAVIGPGDVSTVEETIPGMLTDPSEAVGKEAHVVLYAGRPIQPDEVGPPALIDRNQIVPLVFSRAGLTILAEGRSLSRAGVGEAVRVMNTVSHTTVTGIVAANGSVVVGGLPAEGN